MDQLLALSSPITFSQVWNTFLDFLPHLAFALVIFGVGMLLIRFVVGLVGKWLARSKIDVTLHAFIRTAIKIALWVVLAIICMELLGIPTAPVIASFSVIGVAFSLAAQDSLANVASGLMLLVSKPFSVGDYVQIDALEGTVSEVGFVHTILTTIDNKHICIPNSDITTDRIINYSSEPYRRLDIIYHIGYEDDFDLARSLLLQAIESSQMAQKDPPPLVRMNQHGDSAIDIICQVWVPSGQYLELKYYLNEEVKRQFDAHHISIPYQQVEVHLHS